MLWAAQIVAAGVRELDAKERKHARELLTKLAKERGLGQHDRAHLGRLARKVSAGAGRGAIGRRPKR